jgi:hypothetical protein
MKDMVNTKEGTFVHDLRLQRSDLFPREHMTFPFERKLPIIFEHVNAISNE